MSRFATNSRDRISKKYIAWHKKLQDELGGITDLMRGETPPTSDSLDKRARHRKHSAEFRAGRT